MKRKKDAKRLSLSRETLAALDPKTLAGLVRGEAGCQESHIICSIRHTCVSCRETDTCTLNCA